MFAHVSRARTENALFVARQHRYCYGMYVHLVPSIPRAVMLVITLNSFYQQAAVNQNHESSVLVVQSINMVEIAFGDADEFVWSRSLYCQSK